MFLKKTLLASCLLMSLGAQAKTLSPKQIVSAFTTQAFEQRQPVEAAMTYISAKKYIQHNPNGKDGREAFIHGFAQYVLNNTIQCVNKRIIADGDLVAVHSHCKERPADPSDRGSAVVDIFRVEDGKIVEHWDVSQDVPEESNNTNTMF
jgi:predicted SnoaL-like aldol condensation-catalyzing enzyme